MKITLSMIFYWLAVGSMVGIVFASCGRDRVIVQEGKDGEDDNSLPGPNPGGNIPGTAITWEAIAPIVEANCKPCHAEPFVQSETGFNSGRPEARIKAGTMPPANSRQAPTFNAVKSKVLQYFDQ